MYRRLPQVFSRATPILRRPTCLPRNAHAPSPYSLPPIHDRNHRRIEGEGGSHPRQRSPPLQPQPFFSCSRRFHHRPIPPTLRMTVHPSSPPPTAPSEYPLHPDVTPRKKIPPLQRTTGAAQTTCSPYNQIKQTHYELQL